jgi:hypothetical protein
VHIADREPFVTTVSTFACQRVVEPKPKADCSRGSPVFLIHGKEKGDGTDEMRGHFSKESSFMGSFEHQPKLHLLQVSETPMNELA